MQIIQFKSTVVQTVDIVYLNGGSMLVQRHFTPTKEKGGVTTPFK